jgi:hypothetical protein
MRKRTIDSFSEALTASLIDATKVTMVELLAPLVERVCALERRVDAIEAGRLPGWRGEARS